MGARRPCRWLSRLSRCRVLRCGTAGGRGTKVYRFTPCNRTPVEATVTLDFSPVMWDDALIADCRALLKLAVDEDGGVGGDVTSRALGLAGNQATVHVAARAAGVAAGVEAIGLVFEQIDATEVAVELRCPDGERLEAGARLATIEGDAAAILLAERTLLNLLGRLCGIATLAAQFADAVTGTGAAVYDTRKTTPGWRRLEKYAVRCGGCHNHRRSLSDAFLIKDNHLAFWTGGEEGATGRTLAAAVEATRRYAAEHPQLSGLPVEIEVDTLEQLESVLPAGPEIVLLDNMTPDELRAAAALRDALAPDVALEASGGIDLERVAAIAATGVERVSVGSLTHGARSLDVGLDWGR